MGNLVYYEVDVKVWMKDSEGVNFLSKTFGGKHGITKQGYFRWEMSGRAATPCLRALLPHLKLKRRIQNAKLCIAFNETLGTQGKPISVAVQRKRERLFKQVSRRNVK